MYFWMGLDTSKWGLENPRVQEFIKREDLQFDLILAEQFYQESFLMFAHKFKAPIVTIGPLGPSDFFDRIMGSLTPWSFVPHSVILHYGDNMSFFERCYNFALSTFDAVLRKYYYIPRMDKMARISFQDLGSMYYKVNIENQLLKSHFRKRSSPYNRRPGKFNINYFGQQPFFNKSTSPSDARYREYWRSSHKIW